MNNEEQKRIGEFHERMKALSELLYMCNNAPRDHEGNVVVDVVGVNKIGVFYLFHN